jgi:transposase
LREWSRIEADQHPSPSEAIIDLSVGSWDVVALMGCRRLVRDYELLPETSETFIYLAMIRIMVRRLA